MTTFTFTNKQIQRELQKKFTFTDQEYVVVTEAHGTLAAEASNLIDTHSAGTDTWDLPALVDVCNRKKKKKKAQHSLKYNAAWMYSYFFLSCISFLLTSE